MENNEVVENQKKKSKKGLIIGLIIGASILLILSIVFFLLFVLKPKYKIQVNAGGGTITRNIVMEDNTIKELPEVTPPEGKVLVAWINQKYEAVRPDIEITEDTTLVPIFEDKDRETVTLKFVTGYELQIPDIIITKGTKVILPVAPVGPTTPKNLQWKFLNWIDDNGFVIPKDKIITEDTTIYAYWFKPNPDWGDGTYEEVTISFKTGTKEKIDSIKLVKGSSYLFPIPSVKNGDKIFKGWLDEDGKLLTKEDKVEKDITLTAKWIEPYTCPENCTPNEDGKTCTKKTTVAPSTREICTGEEWEDWNTGYVYCIEDTYNIDPELDCYRQCADGEPFGNYEVSVPIVREGLSTTCCVKKAEKKTEYSCPEGYEKDGDNCTLTETIECTKN